MAKDFITITNEDIYKELQHLKEVGQATLDQALKTNGRVTRLEKISLGNWIANHPFKFTLGVIIFISLLTPEAREVVFTYAKSKL